MKKGDIKYVGGKKVVVVEPSGDGNGAIVQEIHMDGEEEFPAGPTFFTKGLEDELKRPLTWEGWKMQSEKAAYKTSKAALEVLRGDIQVQVEANKAHLSALRQIEKLDSLRGLDRVVAFLAGDIKYIAVIGCGDYSIDKFVDAITSTDICCFKRYNGLKLMTLIGERSNGKKCLSWNLNHYSDGSGFNTTVIPCQTKKEAVAAIQASIDKDLAEGKYVNIDNALAVGCAIPNEYIQKRLDDAEKKRREYMKKKDEDRAKTIATHDVEIRKLKAMLI